MSILKNKLLSPFVKDGRFYNHAGERKRQRVADAIGMLHSFSKEACLFIKSISKGRSRLPENIDQWIVNSNIIHNSIQPTITWIGHASFLIQIGGINILTDPIFGKSTFLFPRILPPGININNLPNIDFVLISHNHMDHMDALSLIHLKKNHPNMQILVPFGDKRWFDSRGFNKVTEHVWWENQKFISPINNQEILFTFCPSHHWSQRGLFDQNKSLWGSWMIQYDNQTIYFAGDTAYSHHFNEISKEFPDIDVTLMPVGPCEPREFMKHSHISSEEAGKAFLELNARHFIPMHWGTFHFGIDTFDLPIKRLKQWWGDTKDKLHNKTLNILKVGQQAAFGYKEPVIIKATKPVLERLS